MELTLTEGLILAAGAMAFGMILLVRGGGWTIDSAVYLARHMGISPLVVGFTVVAFGTSLPELVVSVFANMQGSAGIAIGNVIGSNIANLLLVLAVAAIFSRLYVRTPALLGDILIMLLSTALLAGLLNYGGIGRATGAGMILFLMLYVYYRYDMAKRGALPTEIPENPEFSSMRPAAGFLFIGLVCIALGAEFLVHGAQVGALALGVPEAVIALSLIALGTSLPELSTCIIAARKGHGELVLGNVIGSNVFNILMILGIASIIKPITIGAFEPQLATLDVWVACLAAAVFAGVVILGKQMGRTTGIIFCLVYAGYNIFIYTMNLMP